MNSLKQGNQLKQTKSLSVTPQMQQRLKILQCNHMELETEIMQILDNNIMLKRTNSDFFIKEEYCTDSDYYNSIDEYNPENIPNEIIDNNDDIEWETSYTNDSNYNIKSNTEGFKENWISDSISFDELLEKNIHLSPLNDSEKAIAILILSNLDENYFLTLTHKELANKLNVSIKKINKIVNIIKHLDPPGVACQNIRECLLAQLHSKTIFNDTIADAHDILTEYFSYIGIKNSLIKKRLGLNDNSFDAAIGLIRSLSPYPRLDDKNNNILIYPDVFVHEKNGFFYASINNDKRYDIVINEEYLSIINECDEDEKNYMKVQLQTAKFFLQSLEQRNKTILRVSNAVIMHQQDYFTQGEKALKPLIMKDVSKMLDLAESTISRAVDGKYISFNQNLIELKYFFSNGLENNNKDKITSTKSIKTMIKEIIDRESKYKPLSDSKIEIKLKDKGINISRRTIAKYRESISIPSASIRKQKK